VNGVKCLVRNGNWKNRTRGSLDNQRNSKEQLQLRIIIKIIVMFIVSQNPHLILPPLPHLKLLLGAFLLPYCLQITQITDCRKVTLLILFMMVFFDHLIIADSTLSKLRNGARTFFSLAATSTRNEASAASIIPSVSSARQQPCETCLRSSHVGINLHLLQPSPCTYCDKLVCHLNQCGRCHSGFCSSCSIQK